MKLRLNFKTDPKEGVCFPEGKIQLEDGRWLDCYSKKEQPTDTRSSNESEDDVRKMVEMEQQAFLQNAFFFLHHAERILSDSRMFLAYVPIPSGLAYIGNGYFYHPTLGVYIEYWLNCEKSRLMEENGEEWLAFYFAGSPLTGINSCDFVNKDGQCKIEHVGNFSDTWYPFAVINQRYNEAKTKYEAYTLQEVADILHGEFSPLDEDMDYQIAHSKRYVDKLYGNLRGIKYDYDKRFDDVYHVYCKSPAFEVFLKDYCARKAETDVKYREILAACKDSEFHLDHVLTRDDKAQLVSGYESHIQLLTDLKDWLGMYCKRYKGELQLACLRVYKPKLEEFIVEYRTKKALVDALYKATTQKREELKAQEQRGEITHKKFQEQWMPLLHQRKASFHDLEKFEQERLAFITKHYVLTARDVEKYLSETDKELTTYLKNGTEKS